nr:unnamed protein product [Callosobruchus analis]
MMIVKRPGHTHMECDSMHATMIQLKVLLSAKIFIPNEWVNVVRLAKESGQPYEVTSCLKINALEVGGVRKGDFGKSEYSQLTRSGESDE